MIVFFKLNGFGFHSSQDELVALTTDAAEGLVDVANIAGSLKAWAFDEVDNLPEE